LRGVPGKKCEVTNNDLHAFGDALASNTTLLQLE
jgi:hypothetical protein